MTNTLENLKHEMPIDISTYTANGQTTGLIVVDAVHGFCTAGCGPLAPAAPDDVIDSMVHTINQIATDFKTQNLPIFVTLDSHSPDIPEPPYPPHCIVGTGHDELVDDLKWLGDYEHSTLLKKDCINAFVGAMDGHKNTLLDWINNHKINNIIVVGICTDICVMDLVLTVLSARNHQLCPTLSDVYIYEPACATYDLPRAVTEQIELPVTLSHPRDITHYMGLYFMASRGAVIVDRVSL